MGPLGGLAKQVGLVKSVRARAPALVLEGGDSLFTAARLPLAELPAAVDRADLIMRAAGRAGVDAWVPGALDLTAGLDRLTELADLYGVPLLASNVVDGKGQHLFEPALVRRYGDARVLLLGVVDPKRWRLHDRAIRVMAPLPALRAQLRQIAQPKDLVLVVAQLDIEQAVALARALPRSAAVLAADGRSFTFMPREVARPAGGAHAVAPVVAAGNTGQHLVRLDLTVAAGDPVLHGGAVFDEARVDLLSASRSLQRNPGGASARRRMESSLQRLASLKGRTRYFFHFVDLDDRVDPDPEVSAWRAGLASPEAPPSPPR